jgi:RNA polymerase sigma-70 factor (ECF subfamily)
MRAFRPPLRDPKKFSDLYQRTHIIIYRFIFGMLGGPIEEVEDMTCETFMRAWNGRDRFNGDEHDALCWLFTIARHLIIDAHRKRKTKAGIQEVSLDDGVLEDIFGPAERLPEEQVAYREQFIHLWKALAAIADEKREVLVLRYMLGWKVKEIAEYVHKEENTVSVSIRRSLEEIRNRWPGE